MKIGIISINLYSKWLNSACPLHSYAMQEFLIKNGYECQVIDYKASYYDNYNMLYPVDYYREKFKFKLERFPASEKKRDDWFKTMSLIKDLESSYSALQDERASRYKKYKNFIDTRLNVTEKGYTSVSLEFEDPGFDCYMCVTDVIWKAEPELERAFFLASKCMDNKIKIAYSASRGSDHTRNEKQKKQFFKYLKDFDAISVREPSLKEHIDENSDLESTVVLDPVMLHGADFYEEIAQEPEEKGYLFLYHVVQAAEDTIEQAVKYAKAHDLTIIEYSDRPYPEGKLSGYEGIRHKWVFDSGIEQWLGYIKNADCIFTNSFHCCCLSIIFGKNFFAGSRNGDKVDVVLNTFGLDNRRFDMNTDILGNDPGDIDYGPVHSILEKKREESGNWLLEALRKAEEAPERHKDYETERKNTTYPVVCNLNIPDDTLTAKERDLKSPNIRTTIEGKNNGETVFEFQKPYLHSYRFVGWSFRCKIDKEYYRFTKGGKFIPWEEAAESDYKIFRSGNKIPYIPANGIVNVTADAIWEKLVPTFSVMFNSTLKTKEIADNTCDTEKGRLYKTKKRAFEYRLNGFFKNDGTLTIPECPYKPKSGSMRFMGWKIRFLMDEEWKVYVDEDIFAPFCEEEKRRARIFLPGEKLPLLPEAAISDVVLFAVWIDFSYTMAYHSGTLKAQVSDCTYDEELGSIIVTNKGAFEYWLNENISIEGTHTFDENGFISQDVPMMFNGWYLRVNIKKIWSWYLEDGTLVNMDEYSPETHGKRRVFEAGEKIENLNLPEKTKLVAVATWRQPKN